MYQTRTVFIRRSNCKHTSNAAKRPQNVENRLEYTKLRLSSTNSAMSGHIKNVKISKTGIVAISFDIHKSYLLVRSFSKYILTLCSIKFPGRDR